MLFKTNIEIFTKVSLDKQKPFKEIKAPMCKDILNFSGTHVTKMLLFLTPS